MEMISFILTLTIVLYISILLNKNVLLKNSRVLCSSHVCRCSTLVDFELTLLNVRFDEL